MNLRLLQSTDCIVPTIVLAKMTESENKNEFSNKLKYCKKDLQNYCIVCKDCTRNVQEYLIQYYSIWPSFIW